jgi:S1-C subfamily serine protease
MQFLVRDLDGPEPEHPIPFPTEEVFLTRAPHPGTGVRISAARPGEPAVRLSLRGGVCRVTRETGAPEPLVKGVGVDGTTILSGTVLRLGPEGPRLRIAILTDEGRRPPGLPGVEPAHRQSVTKRLLARGGHTALMLKERFESELASMRARSWIQLTLVLLVLVAVAVGGGLSILALRHARDLAQRQIEEQQERIEAQEAELLAQQERQRLLDEDLAKARRQLLNLLAEATALRFDAERFQAESQAIRVAMQAELEELAARKDVADEFQEFAAVHEQAVVLVFSQVQVKDDNGIFVGHIEGYGTGFVVHPDGWVVTNKHVVQPWKFRSALRASLKGMNYSVDETSQVLSAWLGGTRALDEQGHPDHAAGYSTVQGSLRIVRTAPDDWTTESISVSALLPDVEYQVHAPTDSDLAILRLEPPPDSGPFNYLQMAPADAPEPAKLDRIMVIGFPHGTDILESGRAESSPSLGIVRKVEKTIYVSASVIPGNSGGPVLSRAGTVIGVATRVVTGNETLGICIRIEHARRLLEEAVAAGLALPPPEGPGAPREDPGD